MYMALGICPLMVMSGETGGRGEGEVVELGYKNFFYATHNTIQHVYFSERRVGKSGR